MYQQRCKMNKKEIISKLEKLNLPKNKYAVFGSGPIAIRELRESNDIDIICTKDLFEKLKKEHPKHFSHTKDGDEKLNFDDIEIFYTWRNLDTPVEQLIKESELIEGFPFVKLKYVKEWKQNRAKDKDKKDIELIDNFLNKN